MKWLKALLNQGYEVHLIFLWLRNSEIASERVNERVRLGGHNIPEETIRRRYRKGASNFFSLYQNIAKTWVVYDHSVANFPELIATGNESEGINIANDSLWLEFCEVAK